MTTQHEAMKAALEALEWHYAKPALDGYTDIPQKRDAKAIRALKSALAAAPTPSVSAEPVAWLYVGEVHGDELDDWEIVAEQSKCERLNEAHAGNSQALPLYAHPPTVAQPTINAQLVEALREAEEYIAQHSQATGYGLLDHDHDRYERLPLLERLSAALSAAEAAQKGTT